MKQTLPEATLEYKWGIPYFYYKRKPFCYLNASHKRQYVDVAFFKGYSLTLHQNKLIGEGRFQVKSLRYKSLEEIENNVIIDLLLEQKRLVKIYF